VYFKDKTTTASASKEHIQIEQNLKLDIVAAIDNNRSKYISRDNCEFILAAEEKPLLR